MDGVDAVLVEIDGSGLRVVEQTTLAYPPELAGQLHAAIAPNTRVSLHDFATLDIKVGRCFATAALTVLQSAGIEPDHVNAIGSHGQTLRHAPHEAVPYSLQIGDPATIAARTGIVTVGDFRALDVAYGGEGAPLVPPFHAFALGSAQENRLILNIGGIANLSLLTAGAATASAGFDSGPGNCLMDLWSASRRGLPFDAEGAWAASGTPDDELLTALLDHAYFIAPPPKSTGREVFNSDYLEARLTRRGSIAPCDVQATLAEFTVDTIVLEIDRIGRGWAAAVYVCGGGTRNRHLMRRLQEQLAPLAVHSTAELGLAPAIIEATAFAWLAAMRLAGRAVSLTTGGVLNAVNLGAVYLPTPYPADSQP
jgi:anhydro-N-acetylmuramic acid kinase